MRLLAWLWNAARIVHESLGLKRELFVLLIVLMPLAFHDNVRAYLATRGVNDWPVVEGAMPAMLVAGSYLYWRLVRHVVIIEYMSRPKLVMRMLDPSLRYDTYVALGNRMLRIYHVEITNASIFKTAHDVSITLVDYQKAGDTRRVEIRSRLKVANADAETIDLNPGARVAFELCGIEVHGTQPAAPETRDTQTFSIIPPGSGTLRLFAESKDAPACEDELRLYVDTNGSLTIRPQSASA